MAHDVSLEHPGVNVEFLSFNDNVLDAANIGFLSLETGQPLNSRVTSNKEAMVRIGGRHSWDSDSGLGKDLVNGQGHHILGLDGCKTTVNGYTTGRFQRIFCTYRGSRASCRRRTGSWSPA